MSYGIVKGRRVVVIPDPDNRLGAHYQAERLLFVWQAASNNVSPRTFDWNPIAFDYFSDWGGEVQLPSKLWQMGSEVDGGMLQPHNRAGKGVAWIATWKRAVRDRRPAVDAAGELLWRPRICPYFGTKEKAAALNQFGVGAFDTKGHESWAERDEKLYAAFLRLWPEPVTGEYFDDKRRVETPADLVDACLLYQWSERLPFGLTFADDADSAFFREQQPMLV